MSVSDASFPDVEWQGARGSPAGWKVSWGAGSGVFLWKLSDLTAHGQAKQFRLPW